MGTGEQVQIGMGIMEVEVERFVRRWMDGVYLAAFVGVEWGGVGGWNGVGKRRWDREVFFIYGV